MTTEKTPVDYSDIYSPVAAELPLVDERILEVSQVEFGWLASLARQVLSRSGKRMRPAVTLLVGKMFDYNLDLLLPMAASVEMLHTASLVHDDTLDGALLRRGSPTLNKLWNGSIAILFGDYLFAASAEMVSRTSNVRVMRLFAQTLMVVCSGELSQHFRAHAWQLSREEYYKRIDRKTASLFSMATESGAVLGKASEDHVQSLKEYGRNIGLAFQIMDDVLDLTGEERTLGKPAGSDLLNGTLTLPTILLLDRYPLNNPIVNFFERGRQADDHARVLEMVRNSSVIDDSVQLAKEFSATAMRALERVPNVSARRSLLDLAEYALVRQY